MPSKTPGKQNPIAEALKPLAAQLRQQRSTVRPVSQVVLTLTESKGDPLVAARKACLQWMAKRAGRPIPEVAWNGESFELEEVGAQRVAAVGTTAPVIWAARVDDADKEIAQRTWVTEIGLGRQANGPVLFGARLICVTRGEDRPFERTVPGFVRGIVESGVASLDGRVLAKDPWLVKSEDDVERLVALLTDPARVADVTVFALPQDSVNPKDTSASAEEVHRRTLGAAHVAILTGPASFHLTDRLGKEFSVFHRGVRTYLAGFNQYQDEPFKHPLGLPERIAAWSNGGPDGYVKMLVSQTLARSVARPDREDQLPSFATIRQVAAQRSLERAKKTGSSDKELLALALDEIAQLRKARDEEKKDNDALLLTAQQEREEALQAAQQANARADVLRRGIESLERRLEEAGARPADIPIPDDLEGFQVWCEKYLAGAVDIHNRAYQGVKKSQYQDRRLLYQALLVLRNFYVPMRREPSDAAKKAYEKECARLGLEESGTITDSRLGEQGDTYLVNYSGKKRVLDRHLKGPTSRDQRFCFRLYFFWDEGSEQAVVGWLPSHLDTRQT